MKNLNIGLCALLSATVSQTQTIDSLTILGIYDDFQKTVIDKYVVNHTALLIS